MIAGDAVIPFENDFPKKTKLLQDHVYEARRHGAIYFRKKLHEDGGRGEWRIIGKTCCLISSITILKT